MVSKTVEFLAQHRGFAQPIESKMRESPQP